MPTQGSLFQALIATAVDGVMVIDDHGIVQVYNEACRRLFQYDPEEVLGRNVKILMPAPYREEHDGYLDRYKTTGERRIIGIGREVVGQRKDGTTFPMYLSVGEGRAEGRRIFVGIVHDLSAQREEEAQRLLLSSAVDGAQVMVRELDGTVRLWTSGMEGLYGFSAAEIVGRNSHAMLQTRFSEPIERINAWLLANDRWSGDLRHTTKDGRRIVVASEWALYRPADGPALITEVNHDVTSLRQMESTRGYLASIVESSADAIIGKTLLGKITAWNAAAQRMFGYTADEVLGLHIGILFPRELLFEEDEIIARMRAGDRVEGMETRRRHKDGHDILVSLTVSPIRNAAGEIIGASKIVRDITEKKAAEARYAALQAELIHLSRWNMMGSMASSMAHELNQPLAAMTNYLNTLRRVIHAPQQNPKLVNELIEKATQQGQRAATIIQRLRDQVAKGKSEKRAEDLVDVVKEALELAAVTTKQHSVQVIFEAKDELPPLMMDRVQIQQVIINLVRNAAEAMADGPHKQMQIDLVPEQDGVRVQIADTGPGLPSAVTDHLFEAFVTTKPQGMGLGLSICHQIVGSHGAQLTARPNKPCGTVFSFTLPKGEL
ncbi:MAG TPA: PAS domain S-box protein [Rhizomicrobium sp.]